MTVQDIISVLKADQQIIIRDRSKGDVFSGALQMTKNPWMNCDVVWMRVYPDATLVLEIE